ncbi:ATP-dependent nuclease [Enterococcus casseliflavus]|uniref:ATP-dependent nuclease n=1 Tax=Enterococcus casseliflavus TaxID=37734 RepID=UPI002DB65298|nr:AAA family ATPase [Enterococcus casseliflavus]MEB8399162.1 AAA family ATPase [Enterococcus casseliflavus]
MKISSICIQNFRKLRLSKIDFSDRTTLFVGANNSGKTTAMDALSKFLAGRTFDFNDFTISNRVLIDQIGDCWISKEVEIPDNLKEWEQVLPKMDIWLGIGNNEFHYVADIIPTLKWRGGKLGIRIVYQPMDIANLFLEYRLAYEAARDTESFGNKEDKIHLFPTCLSEFLNKKIHTFFALKSYILNPDKYEQYPPQKTQYEMDCFTNNPLKKLIRINMIDAQRGFSDPDTSNESVKTVNQLSNQMRRYYDRHLDPEKIPTPEDIEILRVTEEARNVFDNNLEKKFSPAIKELESLGYPGLSNPKITISTRFRTSETLNHDSAVQYSLSRDNLSLRLPEKYNGLGYQNLISMVFDLMSFRDNWMKVGKARKEPEYDGEAIEPLHLVLVEEPEAHLHMQVQQVFIRKAYSVLRKNKSLEDNLNFSTQLVISTHSSHIARETDFANLRYFKRVSENEQCQVSTAQVVNLSDVFGKGDKTDKFVTRYLQSTHCDLFFADAVILVEGSAENMLVPHFIRNHYPELHSRYINILNINGRHSQRLDPLIQKLCIPTLVISDLDSAEKNGYHKAAIPKRNTEIISSNAAITKWLVKEKDFDKLLSLNYEEKVFHRKHPYDYAVRIAYQTPVFVKYSETDEPEEALSSTFEDCLIYSNYELFKYMEETEVGVLMKKVKRLLNESKPFIELHKDIYNLIREGKSDEKAEFALDLIYAFSPEDLTIPPYIAEGLKWLEDLLQPVEV